MVSYRFKDYNALFDLIEYTKIKSGIFFKIIKHYRLENIDDLYEICKKKSPKKDKVITSNIDSHIARALDLLLYSKEEIILPVARFYGEKLKTYLEKSGIVDRAVFTGGLVQGKPTLKTIDLLISTSFNQKVEDILQSFSLFKKYIRKERYFISFESIRGHIFTVYISDSSFFGNASFYLSFSDDVRECLKSQFPTYDIMYDKILFDKKIYRFDNEKELFRFLDMQFIPYEIRWDRESIEKAKIFELPKLIRIEDIKGDFHIHTFFSDGEGDVEDVINEAKNINYNYVAITEHSTSQKTGNGITPSDWILESNLIESLKKKYTSFKIIKGLEVDILKDGGLDFPYEILKQMDMVILALHHPENGTLDPNERIAYAMRSGLGKILAHPKDRYWGKESKFSPDLSYLFENALRYNVALEISSIPDRIGFSASEIKEGKKKGVKFAINSDAHAPGYVKNIDIGIIRARRGWLTKDDVINTYSYNRLVKKSIIKNNYLKED